jgi:Kef-type K+ transport system membrane component KefB
MEQAQLFKAIVDICILIIAAELATTICVRFKLPRIIGPLLAGVLFGPYLLGGLVVLGSPLIEYNDLVLIFGEIGAVLLLFQAGLHMRFSDLIKSGVAAFVVAVVGVVVPFGFGIISSSLLGYDLTVGLIIGGSLSATSIAISLKTLGDLHQLGSPEAKLIIAAAVIDDVLALSIASVILGVVGESQSLSVFSFIRSITATLVVWFAFSFFSAWAIPRFTEYVDKLERLDKVDQHLVPIASVLLCFGFAGLSGLIGLSPLVGAFVAGMAVAGSRFEKEVESFVDLLGVLFIPLFFILAGAGVNPGSILSGNFLLIGVLGVGAVISKLVGCGLPAEFFLKDRVRGLRVGYGMISRGEIGLVIASIGTTYGILTDEVYAALVAVVFITTLIPPFLLKSSYELEQPSKKHKLIIFGDRKVKIWWK